MHIQCGCTTLTILMLWGERWQVWQKISKGINFLSIGMFDCLQIMLFEHMPTSAQLNLSCLAAPAYKADRNTAIVDPWPARYLMVMRLQIGFVRVPAQDPADAHLHALPINCRASACCKALRLCSCTICVMPLWQQSGIAGLNTDTAALFASIGGLQELNAAASAALIPLRDLR